MVERIRDVNLGFQKGPNGIRMVKYNGQIQEMPTNTPAGRAQQVFDELVQHSVSLGGIPVSYEIVRKQSKGLSPFQQRNYHMGPHHSKY